MYFKINFRRDRGRVPDRGLQTCDCARELRGQFWSPDLETWFKSCPDVPTLTPCFGSECQFGSDMGQQTAHTCAQT